MSTTLDRYKIADLGHADGLPFGVLDTRTESGVNSVMARTGSPDYAETIALALNTQTATVELAEAVVDLDRDFGHLRRAVERVLHEVQDEGSASEDSLQALEEALS